MEDFRIAINKLQERRAIALKKLEEIEQSRQIWQREIGVCDTMLREHYGSICNKIIEINNDLLEMRDKNELNRSL